MKKEKFFAENKKKKRQEALATRERQPVRNRQRNQEEGNV